MKSDDIINGLQGIVNNYSSVAIIWHVVLYAFIVALLARWLPTNKLFVLLMCLPLISVAIMAFTAGNPFNGILFSILTIHAFTFGLRAAGQPVQTSTHVFMVIGIVMIVFGLVYPHFII